MFCRLSPLCPCRRHCPPGQSLKRLCISFKINFQFLMRIFTHVNSASVPELDTWTPSSRPEYEKTLEGVLAHAPAANALLPWQIRICTQATFFSHPGGQFHNFAPIRASRLVHGWSGVNLPGEWIGWVDACVEKCTSWLNLSKVFDQINFPSDFARAISPREPARQIYF